MSYLWILVPFLLQTIIIILDEAYFHIRRGLPLWERIGHPLDTLSVLACIAFVLFVPFSAVALKWFIALAVLSCLLVTKDEFVHKHHCPASEQWLHALLFLNHPILLTGMGLIWRALSPEGAPPWLANWLCQPEVLRLFLCIQAAGVALFFLYQVIYWNFLWKPKTS